MISTSQTYVDNDHSNRGILEALFVERADLRLPGFWGTKTP